MLDFKQHIINEYPKEACGVIVSGVLYICKNISETPLTNFILNPVDLALAMDNGNLNYILHSHCDIEAIASDEDIYNMKYFSANWIIYSCINKEIVDEIVYDRTGKEIRNR